MAKRGAVAAPFVTTWRTGKRGRSKDSAYALGQLAAMADEWRRQDIVDGRRPELIVARKRSFGWIVADLAQVSQ